MNKTRLLVNSLTLARKHFFEDIARLIPKFDGKFIIVTHILNDREELLSAISQIGEIALVIAIPYSIDIPTLQSIRGKYSIITPSLSEMRDTKFLMNTISRTILEKDKLIILEIGGYFAQLSKELHQTLGSRFIGVIESTEAGHRQYEKKLPLLEFPVISVCRGSLKKTEYSVVGSSCVFSTERLIRKAGFLLQGKKALVIGFGKVGQGLARSLLKLNCIVSVYDTNPILRVLAHSEGFQIPEKEDGIKNAYIIFGATGNESISSHEIPLLQKGCILVSATSKDIEFDMSFIRDNYSIETAIEHIEIYLKNEHFFYVLAEGLPVNFLDGAVMGPVLALVQSEIVFSIKTLLETNQKNENGIFEVDESDRKMLATRWLNYFNESNANNLYEYI